MKFNNRIMIERPARIRQHTLLLGALACAIGTLLLLLITLSSVSAELNESHTGTVLSSNAIQNRWRILADMHAGRGDAGAVTFNDKIYVMGGFFSNGSGYPNSLEIYNPISDSWQIQYGVPVTRSDLMVATVEDKIYAIGGFREGVGSIGLNDMYDPGIDTWITRTSMITPVSGAGVVVISDSIHILGGYDGNSNLRNVQIYNTVSDSWSLGIPMPTGRSEFGAALVNGEIFAIGGVVQGGMPTNKVEVFSLGTSSWGNGPTLPEGRASMAVVARGGNIYAIGGTDNWATKSYVTTTFVYEPGSGSWSTGFPMPTGRWANEAAVVGDRIYVVGGIGEPGAGKANEGFGFEPISTTTTITDDEPDPSLQYQPFNVDFVVTSTKGIPTEKVTVTVSNSLETCNVTLVSGAGSCKVELQSPGTYTITASYSGDEFFAISSDIEEHVVLQTSFTYVPLVTK